MYFSYEIEKKRNEVRGMVKFANKENIDIEKVIYAIVDIYKISEIDARNLVDYVINH